MRIASRGRASSLSSVPPPPNSEHYSVRLAALAAHILYRSPLPSQNDLRVYILNAAAFPDHNIVDYDVLLPYVLARLPDEEELLGGRGYEVVFFAGGEERGTSRVKKGRPGWGWFLQAYHVLSRAMRKRLQKLYVVHERAWIRVTVEMFSTVVSPKVRKKIVHVSGLSALALHIPIEDLLIPPYVYHNDRQIAPDIDVPYATGRRAFGATTPLPISRSGSPRLPRVLRESSSFLLTDRNIRTEGLFRINARAVTLSVLKEAYDRGQKFIVWREGDSVLTFPHWKEGTGDVMVEELEQAEGFGVYAAAGLIKLWYSQLQEPIFPQTSYPFLDRVFGSSKTAVEVSSILDLVGEQSEWSPLSKVSRKIMTIHLLPLLTAVSEARDWNQMDSQNLALCFAPCLIRGSDPIEEAKMIPVLARILRVAIENWNTGLSTSCGMDKWTFEESLRIPEAIEDREDPLESTASAAISLSAQIEGITLLDNEATDDEEQNRPPLPPRVSTVLDRPDSSGAASPVRRKPAPTVQAPPRYSTIIMQSPGGFDTLPLYEPVAQEMVPPNEVSEIVRPAQSGNVVPRKPVPSASSGT